jgi:lysyl-tRNA synthetase class 2
LVEAEGNRLQVLNMLRERGIDPYPHEYDLIQTIREVRGLPIGTYVKTAGRVKAIRKHGKAFFADLWDEGSKVQAYFKIDVLGEDSFALADAAIDLGDIVGVEGELFNTQMGELTILVRIWHLLVKALKTLPSDRYGIQDSETRYRKRYLTLLVNPRDRQVMQTRFKVLEEVRKFLWSHGFVEVDTPILQPIYGGASAKPFKTHVNALDEDWYLRISPELYLKRLTVAGFNRVFEIAKVFRNEDIDAQHNPEFTLMELYMAYADYNDIMNLTEKLITHLALNVAGTYRINYGDHEINLKPPYRRVKMFDALRDAGIDPEEVSDEELKGILQENGIVLRGGYTRGLALAEVFEKLCRDELVQPTFILDYPAETTPLCKQHRSRPGLIERFELYIDGMEVANAYTELNDPLLQERLLREQAERRGRGDEEAHMYDEDFVEALMYGMPPTGGLGIGIDRLVMILAEAPSIKDVIPFPMVKPKTVASPASNTY